MIDDQSHLSERRLVNRLRVFWDLLKKEDDNPPPFSKFNENSIMDMWDNCLLFYIANSSSVKMYQCQHMGKNLKNAFGKDLKGQYMTSKDGNQVPGRRFMSFLDQCVEKQDFVMSQGSFINAADKVIKYRDCTMPFVSHKGDVTHLVTGVSWKAFT